MSKINLLNMTNTQTSLRSYICMCDMLVTVHKDTVCTVHTYICMYVLYIRTYVCMYAVYILYVVICCTVLQLLAADIPLVATSVLRVQWTHIRRCFHLLFPFSTNTTRSSLSSSKHSLLCTLFTLRRMTHSCDDGGERRRDMTD